MSFCVSRGLTYEATFWRVVPEMVFEDCDEGTPISSCFMEWLKTCRVDAILGIRSGLTYATFWRVVPEMVFEGCDEGTPISSCFMEWLKTCRVHAILGISSGFFYLGETCPSLIALFTSATKRSKGSLSRMVYLPGLLCSLQWNFSPENSLHSI